MANNPYQQYKETSVNTARPEDLVLMLYEGGIKFINKSIIAINENKIQEAHVAIVRSEDIVIQLLSGLDKKRGGQIAIDLEKLYDYMHRRLVEANIKKDVSILEEVLWMFREFRETWIEAIKIYRSQQNKGGFKEQTSITV